MTATPSSLLNPEQRAEIYYWMRLTRRFDETMVSIWKQGRGLGTCFSARGHEAVSIGSGYALRQDEVAAPMHRNVGMFMLRGLPPRQIFANLLGKATGTTRGRDANLHGNGDLSRGLIGFISHIPQSLPVALGAAMSFRYRNQPLAVLTVCGDGGSTAGVFHEVMNMASLYKAPLVVVLENNQYAYSTPASAHSAVPDMADKAAAYNVPSCIVDGNDVEAVYDAASLMLERARQGAGPGLIEAKTMRMLGHAIHDGAEYVPPDLLADWEKRDPVRAYRAKLEAASDLADETLQATEARVDREIEEALAFAEASDYPAADTVLDGVYAR